MKPQFIIIGIDDSPCPRFTEEVLQLVQRGKVFSGGDRHRRIVGSLLPPGHEWIPIRVPLSAVFTLYRQQLAVCDEPIIVFASGDPLFFGFANTLLREWPDAAVRLYPVFNSLQLLAHRSLLRYDDMQTVSLTGRPWHGLDVALMEHRPKIGLLTDKVHTPSAIAARLLEYGYSYYEMMVGEHLGNPQLERVRRMRLAEAVGETFELPNCVLLFLPSGTEMPARHFGIPDHLFLHLEGRPGMMTKSPIRLLSLQALELPRRHVFWDIGFCTGSVSIEACLQFPHLEVVAFEIRPECEELMARNARRFGALGICPVLGDFLQADLNALPAPDAVFIGGHGGKLPSMLHEISRVLRPGGCIVFNSVSEESRRMFTESVEETGLLQLQPPLHIALNDYNPITILKAISTKTPIPT